MLLKLQNISVSSVIFCLELAYDNYIYFFTDFNAFDHIWAFPDYVTNMHIC